MNIEYEARAEAERRRVAIRGDEVVRGVGVIHDDDALIVERARDALDQLTAEVEQLELLAAGRQRLGLMGIFAADAMGEDDVRAAVDDYLAAAIERSRCNAVWLVEPGEFVVPEYVGRHVCAMPTDHAGPHVCAENGYRFHIASAAS